MKSLWEAQIYAIAADPVRFTATSPILSNWGGKTFKELYKEV